MNSVIALLNHFAQAPLPDPANLSLWEKYGLAGLVIGALFILVYILIRKSDTDRDKMLEMFRTDSKAEREANAQIVKDSLLRSDLIFATIFAKLDEMKKAWEAAKCQGTQNYSLRRPPESGEK